NDMLRKVVVPGNSIVIEELEQLVTMLQEPLSELDRRFGFPLGCDDLLVESIDIRPVLCQVLLPQPLLVDCRDDGPQELPELECQPLEFIVERVGTSQTTQTSH